MKIRFVRFREIYEWLCSLTALMLYVIMINTLQQTDNILGKLSVHVRLSPKKKNWCQVNRASEWSVRSDSGPWRWLKWLAIWWMTSRFQTCKDPILLQLHILNKIVVRTDINILEAYYLIGIRKKRDVLWRNGKRIPELNLSNLKNWTLGIETCVP